MPRMRILFVDDEPHFLESVDRLLYRFRDRWQLFFAHSAVEAMDVAAVADLDLVVSDITMPGQDGFWLLNALRNEPRTADIPVLVLTGGGENDLKRKALELGAADLLSKPIGREDLVARLSSVLRLKTFQDRLKDHNNELLRTVKERTAEIEASRREVVWRLAKAGEYRDEDTGDHILRVGAYGRALAKEIGLGAELCETVFLSSPLHDIGKIGISDDILRKPGKLDPDEWATMQQHCVLGEAILVQRPQGLKRLRQAGLLDDTVGDGSNPMLTMAATIARNHHERWDGTGYPDGLAGEAIPLPARITAIADVYDALRSRRPYKEPFSRERTEGIMRQSAGTQFDPDLLRAFERITDVFHEIRGSLAV